MDLNANDLQELSQSLPKSSPTIKKQSSPIKKEFSPSKKTKTHQEHELDSIHLKQTQKTSPQKKFK